MSILSFFRRTKSRYADDKAVDGFASVLQQTKPSAFDVAMEEARRDDRAAWGKIVKDLTDEP